MTTDGDHSYWFNLNTHEVEYGLLSPAVDRAGPFATREEAQRAPQIMAENSRRWADEDEAENLDR
ncbi:MAG: SPOR domain-containing protein [Mycetocola sp.]